MSIVRPYGDTTGDGMVQMSFTLPIPHDKRAEGAALQLAKKMGLGQQARQQLGQDAEMKQAAGIYRRIDGEFAELIADIVEFRGRITFDASRPADSRQPKIWVSQ